MRQAALKSLRTETSGGPYSGQPSKTSASSIPFSRVFKAEILKGKAAAPRMMTLIFPLPLVAMVVYMGLGRHRWNPSFTNYWYALLLPTTIILISASVAAIDSKQHWRTTLALPASPASVWWAKILYCLLLTLGSVVLALGVSILATVSLGLQGPSVGSLLAAIAVLVIAGAWMIPLSLALTTRFGTLSGIALPLGLDLIVSISCWSQVGIWPYLPPCDLLNLPAPLLQVMPDGVPMAIEDPSPIKTELSSFSGHSLIGLAVCLLVFVLLSMLTARWFSGKEAD
ncbi:hypothetical protein CRD60_01910 [Bifidobacterium aemilianum]|uniref:Lantibiotic ABC transporter permease n=1 Tax=Bifidobacterium aemilianum TaxID=2493120 RepID=A0A366KBK0_9BIFI|nr:ABC transporter permease [Bifidobacterium aemilianum]RBP98622.1 hypothetical protein CRD60_01910 [Bifidobacterium aemilianum]